MTLLEIEDVRLEPKKAGSKKAEEALAPEATEAAAKPAPKRQTARATATKTEGEGEPAGAAAEE